MSAWRRRNRPEQCMEQSVWYLGTSWKLMSTAAWPRPGVIARQWGGIVFPEGRKICEECTSSRPWQRSAGWEYLFPRGMQRPSYESREKWTKDGRGGGLGHRHKSHKTFRFEFTTSSLEVSRPWGEVVGSKAVLLTQGSEMWEVLRNRNSLA